MGLSIAESCTIYSPDCLPSDTLEIGFLKAESLFVGLVDSEPDDTEPDDDDDDDDGTS